MDVISFSGVKRTDVGSYKAKSQRKEGRIPAVIYGSGSDAKSLTVTHADVKKLIYTPEFKLAEIELDGDKHKCLIRDVQFHPVTEAIQHIDFLKLTDGSPVKVEIPIRTKGVSPGVKEGGALVQVMRKVKVKANPEDLVDEVFVDISELKLGFSVRVRDLEVTDKMEVLSVAATPVALVEIPRALRSAQTAEEEAAAAEGESEEAPAAE